MITFEEFYYAIHQFSPFPWQSRLAQEVIQSGWEGHSVLGLPTSAGKTSVLDIAVFHLISDIAEDRQRIAPLRTFLIVDRRIVVDGAFQHARKIADALANTNDGPLKYAADLLIEHFELQNEKAERPRPLHVSVMRGGMYRDDAWTSSPIQPTICVSTVDQVGSRLLFRGYGVTPSMRPIHAGLIANDSLLLVDEAHLSEPFLETLAAVKQLTNDATIGLPLQFVRMSATPVSNGQAPFHIDDQDREHPVLKQRLEASKIVRFGKVTVDAEDQQHADEQFADKVFKHALEAVDLEDKQKSTGNTKPVAVVGIVVNRVRAARFIYEKLSEHFKGQPAESILLTGRIRPFDRDQLLFRSNAFEAEGGWMKWIAANRERDPAHPLFVVATQTIEVGADVSFDALITEAAPLDSLRQRFGRLDRRGERKTSQAVIVGRSTAVKKGADDFIYGKSVGESWYWLQQIASGKGKNVTVDFGLNAMEKVISEVDLASLISPKEPSPILQPAYAELWSRTNPAPAVDPDVTRFLHGKEKERADVNVIWRADLLNHSEQYIQKEYEDDYINVISLLTPTRMEACPVPIKDVREWLEHGKAADDLSDVEGAPMREGDADKSSSKRLVVRWRGPESKRSNPKMPKRNSTSSQVISPNDIHSGDTIIVPCCYGGCDQFGWRPTSKVIVKDVAESCVRWSRGQPVLRLHPAVLSQWAAENVLEEFETTEDQLQWLLDNADLPPEIKETVKDIVDDQGKSSTYTVTDLDDVSWEVLTSKKKLSIQTIINESSGLMDDLGEPEESTEGDDQSSLIGKRCSLAKHTAGVVNHVRRFSQHAAVPKSVAQDMLLAAKWHDIGKLDPRFQTMLWGGDEIEALLAAEDGEFLAKSDCHGNDRAASQRARRLAGVPPGFRHEALSVQLLRQLPQSELLVDAADTELVEFLIGSHHGFGRASHPICLNSNPDAIECIFESVPFHITTEERQQSELHRIESDWEGLFARVNKIYGYWGLAWIEAIFRLADHRQSALDANPSKQPKEKASV